MSKRQLHIVRYSVLNTTYTTRIFSLQFQMFPSRGMIIFSFKGVLETYATKQSLGDFAVVRRSLLHQRSKTPVGVFRIITGVFLFIIS